MNFKIKDFGLMLLQVAGYMLHGTGLNSKIDSLSEKLNPQFDELQTWEIVCRHSGMSNQMRLFAPKTSCTLQPATCNLQLITCN